MSAQQQTRVAVLLLSDIVGSVALQHRLGTQAYTRLLSRHNELFRKAIVEEGGGQILNYTGDGFLAELGSPTRAVNAALRLQWLLTNELWEPEPISARVALHLGEIEELTEPGSQPRHVGMAINHVARLMDLAAGSQILLSKPIWDDARRNVRGHPSVEQGHLPELAWVSHGLYRLKGTEDSSIEVFEAGAKSIAPLSQPPDSPKAWKVVESTAPQRDSRSYRQRLTRATLPERKRGLVNGAACALLGIIFLLTGWFDSLSYDLSFVFRPKSAPSEVLIVEVDTASTIQLNQPSNEKWDRRLHAQLLTNLVKLGAKAVAFDIAFTGPSADRAEDQAFSNALAHANCVVLGAAAEKGPVGESSVSVVAPNEHFRAVARWGIVERASNGRAIRRPMTGWQTIPAMSEVTAQIYSAKEHKVPPTAWVNYYGPPGTISHRSYVSVLSNQVPASAISNKVVVVGANTALGYTGTPGTDYFLSPYTRWTGREMAGVEINATTITNLINNEWLKRFHPLVELLLIAGFGFMAGYTLLFMSLRLLLPVSLAIALAVGAIAALQVWWSHIWFPWMLVSALQIPAAAILGAVIRPHHEKPV